MWGWIKWKTLLQRSRHSCDNCAPFLFYQCSSLLTMFTRRLRVRSALYQSMNTNYMVRSQKAKKNHICRRVGAHKHFSSPLRLTSITCLSGAWHLKSRQWNMKERELASWRQGFFRCTESSCSSKVAFDFLIKYHKVIPASDHSCASPGARRQSQSQMQWSFCSKLHQFVYSHTN